MTDLGPQIKVFENDIAIVGMAAHLPGADTIDDYWNLLRSGTSAIRPLTEDELIAAGETTRNMANKNYVPYAARLDGFDKFDAEFWGFGPKEAAIMDPQHRRFLEVSWQALENAGHMPENFKGPIGVYAGCGMGSYFYFNLCSNPDLVDNVGMFLLRHTGNDKDFLSTRLSHILDLKGPSVNVQTACSTSLVATHYAVQALLNGECDMALAGGVTIEIPQGRGYIFKDGEILSPDGECHAFDHRAQGTVFGSGAGVIVLRRLSDAISDGDHIWGVIKGTAVNNDGAAKAGYLAPSVDGQSAAIAEAQAIAGVTADTIDYIECHGTGTYLGDPIEVAALTEAFRETTHETGYCRIGSVKTNIGHLDTAAGVAGLIKTALSLHHREIPASLGYEAPNPAIDFETSPFKVNDRLTDWVSHRGPRRAGVNSLGVGGTNAHIVLEEAPLRPASDASDWPFQILTLSARSKSALDAGAMRLADHLTQRADQNLADVAWTLHRGRRAFDQRRVVVAETHEEAAELLRANNPRRVFSHTAMDNPDVVFMFPGGGAQYAGMARDLYETEPVFADWMDRGLEVLQPKLDYDIRALWLPSAENHAAAVEALKKPSVQLPLIMITEYALAQLWMSWGVTPAALIGHSMGENTAACLAGVMSFEDCIGLVHLRGTLFDTVPAGGMLSVSLPAEKLRAYLGDYLDLASVNAPELSVASGPQAGLDRLQAQLEKDGIDCQRVQIDIAAHSRMLEPILEPFRDYLNSITLNAPQIPFVSNRTGKFITDAQATDPEYWVQHLRGTVHYADGITTLAEKQSRVFLEVGPGKALSSLTGLHPRVAQNQVIGSLRHPDDKIADDKYFLAMLGRMWAVGVDFDWSQIWGDARRHKVVLPSYAFQQQSYYIAPGKAVEGTATEWLTRSDDLNDWGYAPVWRPAAADADIFADLPAMAARNWLVFGDDAGLADAAIAQLRGAGHRVITVSASDAFAQLGEDAYCIAPENGRADYDALISALAENGALPDTIAHMWMVTKSAIHRAGSSFLNRNMEQGFYSLMHLASALADEAPDHHAHICVISNDTLQVSDEAILHVEKATICGPIRVIPKEIETLTVSHLDIALSDIQPDSVLEELIAPAANTTCALRGGKRYQLRYAKTALSENGLTVRDGGTYMITGGFGGIGLALAEDMIKQNRANIVILARTAMPDRDDWDMALHQRAPSDAVVQRINAIRHLESLGGRVLVIDADVCNPEDMRRAVDMAHTEFGEINGVIHAAGVINDAPMLAKSAAQVEQVFGPKVYGTQVLDQLFPDGTLDWIALFASSSTVTAPAGQIDYVAANEYLNAYAKSRKGGQTRVVAVNWGIWNEVGMAANAVAARLNAADEQPVTQIGLPLIKSASFDREGNRVFDGVLTLNDWIIAEHKTKSGQALLPGTGYIELASQALIAHGVSGGFAIRDLHFLRPLNVNGEQPFRLRLARNAEGYAFEVLSQITLDGRRAYQTNAIAQIDLDVDAAKRSLDIGRVFAAVTADEVAKSGETLTSPQEAHLDFGPRWRVLKETYFGDGIACARLSLPAAARNDHGFGIHPALMDLATGWAMKLIPDYAAKNLWVPLSYGEIAVHADLPADIVSLVALRSAAGDTATFDITLVDRDGNVRVTVSAFTIKRLEAGFQPLPAPTAAEVEFADHATAPAPLSPAEERLHHNLAQGILAAEGVVAFRRALASNLPQVIVSSMDLHALIAQSSERGKTEETKSEGFARPELDSEYIAPANEIEATLAGFWSQLLGVQNIGVLDSFFDLGGHSLIAVRLFAMIKKTYAVEFPISVLFEAPTIRGCAAMIEERVGPARAISDVSEPTEQSSAPKRPSFTHLVNMGQGGNKTPFFLVSGMFGNVLNLRHLANLLGTDRPFYGLQARGLLGDQDPHTTMQDAARDMIAEIRQVQPHGPYFIGGFSGGGITAFEIAKQLESDGEEIAMLTMLDTPLPVRRPLSKEDRLQIKLADLKSEGLMYIPRWISNRVKWEIAKRSQTVDASAGHQFHNEAIRDAFMQAANSYQVSHWDGRLCLFRPPLRGKWKLPSGALVNEERAYVLHDNDWTQWVPNVEVYEVPGDHDSMVLEPNVTVLATQLRRCILEAERKINQSRAFDWALRIAAE